MTFAHSDLFTIDDLYDEYETKLHRYAQSLARDWDRADDLVQETFIRAMTHLALLNTLKPYQVRAWLYKVLKNLFLDELRASKRREALLDQLSWQTESTYDPRVEPQAQELIELAPERYREVLTMTYLEGKTSEQIGDELGVPAATIRSRLFLARKWLRAHQSELI